MILANQCTNGMFRVDDIPTGSFSVYENFEELKKEYKVLGIIFSNSYLWVLEKKTE